jgi:chromosome segregation ATPase
MKDWHLELKTLEQQKQNEAVAARLALVADEISELQELETQFTIAGTELNQYKQALVEVIARTSPEITELTGRLNELKSAIKEIDVEMFIQNNQINNANFETVKQQNMVNALAANKNDGDLEFARWMASQQTLIELKQTLETEKSKLTELNNRFYKLKVTPNLANLDRRIRELKTETMTAQQRVEYIERDRREMNSRMMFLRATIAKTEANVAVLA